MTQADSLLIHYVSIHSVVDTSNNIWQLSDCCLNTHKTKVLSLFSVSTFLISHLKIVSDIKK